MRTLLAALVLFALPAWASMSFDDASSEYAHSTSVGRNIEPISMSCWVRSDDAASLQGVIDVENTGALQGRWQTRLRGDVAGDPVESAKQTDNGSANGIAQSTGGYSTGTWHHVVGVFGSNTSRRIWLDGSDDLDTTTTADPSPEATAIGVTLRQVGSEVHHFSGEIAECAIWEIELNADNIAVLAAGYAPPCVRPDSIVEYWPMVRDTSSLKDYFRANNLSFTGTPTPSDHPRILNCQ